MDLDELRWVRIRAAVARARAALARTPTGQPPAATARETEARRVAMLRQRFVDVLGEGRAETLMAAAKLYDREATDEDWATEDQALRASLARARGMSDAELEELHRR